MADEAGKRLISAANEVADSAKSNLDVCMLQSMAASFRHNLDFSFNGEDMADLMERCAETIAVASPTRRNSKP